MARAGGRRIVVAAMAVLILTSATVGTGLAAVSVQSNVSTDAGERPSVAAAAPDTTAVTAPVSRVRTFVTDSGGTASAVATDDLFPSAPSNITATQELQLTPEERGQITVVQRYRVPERVAELKPQLPTAVTVTGTNGFAKTSGQTYAWDGNTSTPSITFTMQVNQTRDLKGPEGARGRYLFVDAGDWALVQRPSIPTSWSWQGGEPVGISREVTTAGPGYVGEWMAYLGAVETHERTAHGQQFRLVVPERATLEESPRAILDSLAAASDQLRVGDRDERVNVFAAPTTTVGWGVRGLQFGNRDMWVRDAEALDTAENTWLHEYVHTRQDYEAAPSAKWTMEAFATYYAALLALEQDHIEYDEFQSSLRHGTKDPQADAVLTEPSTWANAANYLKGSLVAGDTDRRIRVATDQSRSLQAVFSAMNAHQDTVDGRTVFESVGTVADADVRRATVTYASTERSPDVWSQADHAAAFSSTPARVEIGFARDSDAFGVSGPYRTETVSGGELHVFTAETLTVTGVVENAGDASAEYEARFVVDGRIAGSESGTITPGERVRHEFTRTFDETGEHTLAIGGDEVTVQVFEPAETMVTDLSANRTELSGPGAVRFTATVNNSHGVPARGNVTLRGPDSAIIDREVVLGPHANRTVTGVARLQPGEYDFTLGTADTLVVTVGTGDGSNGGAADQNGEGGDNGDGSDGGTFGFGPGFGPATVLVALLGTVVILARRRP